MLKYRAKIAAHSMTVSKSWEDPWRPSGPSFILTPRKLKPRSEKSCWCGGRLSQEGLWAGHRQSGGHTQLSLLDSSLCVSSLGKATLLT